MNEQLQKQLAELIDSANKAGSGLYQFIQSQAPEFCNQVVAWEFWSGVFYGCACLISVSILLVTIIKWWRKSDIDYGEYDARLVATLMSGVLSVLLIGAGAVNAQAVIKCKVAPQLVVVETISSYLKNK